MKNIFRTALFLLPFAISLLLHACAAEGDDNRIGIQLWSVRDDVKEDHVASIEKLGKMGYDFVEAAIHYNDGKMFGMEPEDFTRLVEDKGMKFLGAHCSQHLPDSGSLEAIMAWWDECIEAHRKAGVEYIVQPSMGGLGYSSLEGLQRYCDYFNAVGEKCNAAGIKFGYHNHDKEFTTVLDGERVYDYMLENTDPEKVYFQLDLYWIKEGGQDPLAYIEKYSGRFLSYHIKEEKELGESGAIDFQSSFDAAEQAGVEYYVVEVERYNFEPMESVEKSLEYLREIGFTK